MLYLVFLVLSGVFLLTGLFLRSYWNTPSLRRELKGTAFKDAVKQVSSQGTSDLYVSSSTFLVEDVKMEEVPLEAWVSAPSPSPTSPLELPSPTSPLELPTTLLPTFSPSLELPTTLLASGITPLEFHKNNPSS